MSKLSRDMAGALAGLPLHPRETIFVTGNLGAVNAEIIAQTDGAQSVALDLRGTYTGLSVQVQGSIDGTNWTVIPMRPINQAAIKYVVTIAAAAAQGAWVGSCAPYRFVKALCTVLTTGMAIATLLGDTAALDQSLQGMVTTDIVTVTAAVGVIATLSLPSPGAGLRQYLTYLSVNRFAAAVLTPAATPVLVTTTNLPGTAVISFPADAAAQGTLFPWREDFAYPIAALAQAAAVTVVCPATPNVIWRATAGYYVAP